MDFGDGLFLGVIGVCIVAIITDVIEQWRARRKDDQ
ncbi:MAG: hypothetical protein RLZZ324_897 [Candidatus Parcubacteria bacterium]|jgi:hypothetical protein